MVQSGNKCYNMFTVDAAGGYSYMYNHDAQMGCKKFNNYVGGGKLVGSNDMKEYSFINQLSSR